MKHPNPETSRTGKRIYFTSYAFLFALLVSMFLSCSGAEEPRELFEEQQSGVCMVLNSYYYEITLPNGVKWYCSGIDEDGDLDNFTLDANEIKQNKAMSTGTAFFIGDDGRLLTNRHVVSPVISGETIKKAARSLLINMRDYLENEKSEYAQQFNYLEQQKSDCFTTDYYGNQYVDRERYNAIINQQNELAQNFSEAQNSVEIIENMDMSALNVTSVNDIGIAYNNTFVTSVSDFLDKNPCVVTKVSDDENTDLAVIQLKNKKTPADKHIFTIRGYNDSGSKSLAQKLTGMFMREAPQELEIDQELVMIGFNAGLVLGNTRQGIQVQMTTGRVSQKPDGDKVLYSIPMLKGSSGSPVIDLWGNVRAVNFAKLSGTETFNFGIPEQRMLKFLEQ